MPNRIKPKQYETPIPIAPGFTIQEMLDDISMSQKDLALKMGRPHQAINEIIKGKKAITAETAAQLEIVLGLTQEYWLNREASYQAAKERIEREKSILNDVLRLKDFPYNELETRGLVPITSARSSEGRKQRVGNLYRFLKVSNFSALDNYLGKYGLAARLAQTSSLTKEKLAVWLRLGELQAEKEGWRTGAFRKTELVKSLPELRKLSTETDVNVFLAGLRDIGERCGIVFLFVKEFKGFPTKGMTAWINNKPYIMLTLHGKRWDMLIFTLFHEIGHVLKHDKTVFVEGNNFVCDQEKEDEANEFARDLLIPQEIIDRLDFSNISTKQVIRIAGEIEIDPSILVGRLMWEGLIRKDNIHFQRLLRRVQWNN